MKPPPFTPSDVRAWMVANQRGHAAAAEHFRALGHDVTPEQCREWFRRAGSTKAAGVDAKAHAATKTPDQPRVPSRPNTRAREAPAPPPQGSPEAQLPAVVTNIHPPGSLAWNRHELADLMLRRDNLGTEARAAQAVAQVTRSIHSLAMTIHEQEQAEARTKTTHLTAAQRIERMAHACRRLPLALLEVHVREYLSRFKGLAIVDAAGVVLLASERRDE